ncbi:MAG: Sec-independent protein translocase protein TatB [Pseudomonadota bacterium]|nr:Sec-independent protein translocase protein TatB [Pseudomonadota bacterium]
MIELSLGKMVLLALIALIVLGPEKLPGAARTAGALMRRVRGGWDNVRAEVERELEIEQIKRAAREAAAQAEAAQTAVKDGLNTVHKPLSEVVDKVTSMPKSGAVMTELKPAEPAPIVADVLAPEDTADSPQADLPLGEPPAAPPSARMPPHDDA